MVPPFARPARSSSKSHVGLLCAIWSLFGCQPKVGDECTSNTDCSGAQSRLCFHDYGERGYCTQFCQPGTCPDQSVCVGYRTVVAPSESCHDVEDTRLQQPVCMKRCARDADCRPGDGIVCVDLSAPDNPWGARVLENHAYGKVCAVDYTGPDISQSDAGYCASSDRTSLLPLSADASTPEREAGVDASRPLDAGMPDGR